MPSPWLFKKHPRTALGPKNPLGPNTEVLTADDLWS